MSELTHKEILDTEPTHHEEHIVGPKVYGIIFGSLLVFTAITVGASYLDWASSTPSSRWPSPASRRCW